MELGRGLRSVAPRLATLDAAGESRYLLVLANARGLLMRVLPSPDEMVAPLELEESDAGVRELALAVAQSDAHGQEFLLAWASGCGATSQVRAAAYRWEPSRLERVGAPLVLDDGGKIAGGPTAAFAVRGFARKLPTGGWSVSWLEAADGSTTLRGARIAQSTHLAEPTGVLTAIAGSLPFIHPNHTAPFSYGFVSSASDSSEPALDLLQCTSDP